MRTTREIRADIRQLRRMYHQITCGELRDICRRYGDKQVYMIDARGNEVPGTFVRIHDFFRSFRWELQPYNPEGVQVRIDSIGSARCSDDKSVVKSLVHESFGQWGGYCDVPVYVCDDLERKCAYGPAFAEYTICGDRIIFRRTHEAYNRYDSLYEEYHNAEHAEARELEKQLKDPVGYTINLPKCTRKFPPLFASDMLVNSKQEPRNREERRHHQTLGEQLVGVMPTTGPIGYSKSLRKIYKGK